MISIDELIADRSYQISIPVHPKDYTKIPFIIERCFIHTDATAVHLLAYETEDILRYIPSDSRVHLHHERDILPEGRGIFIESRRGWYFQQFLELFQDVTDTDWYIGLNCDLLFNKRYPVFTPSGQPVQVLSRDKNSQKEIYNRFNLEMFPNTHISRWNYLSDGTLYNKRVTRQMADSLGYDVAGFMRKSAEIISRGYPPGDANLYMHYVNNVYPSLYTVVELSNAMNGRYGGATWTEDDIKKLIANNPNADTISIHCWS